MPNARTDFFNNDFAIVAATVRPAGGGIHNFTVPQGQTHTLQGEEGETFAIAWHTRNEVVSEQEFADFAVASPWGQDFVFAEEGKAD